MRRVLAEKTYALYRAGIVNGETLIDIHNLRLNHQ